MKFLEFKSGARYGFTLTDDDLEGLSIPQIDANKIAELKKLSCASASLRILSIIAENVEIKEMEAKHVDNDVLESFRGPGNIMHFRRDGK